VPFLPSVPSRRLPLLVLLGIFAALAEFERELISERTIAGLASARARGRKGGRPFKMTPAKLRLATASMGRPDTKVGALCAELGITRQTLYRYVSPEGELRPDGLRLLAGRKTPCGGRHVEPRSLCDWYSGVCHLGISVCADLVQRGAPSW